MWAARVAQLELKLVWLKLGLQQSSCGALQASLLSIDTLVITTSACTINPLLLWADLDQFGSNGRRLQPLLPHIPVAAHTRYTERLLSQIWEQAPGSGTALAWWSLRLHGWWWIYCAPD